ncbi:hypothetical protein CsSME_00039271 [Camellia sinensis var. sinensis]
MSSGEVRKVSREDIQLVQNLIERCLQLYMSQKEVVDTLLVQAKIEPDFTELVWQKLEDENRDFFKAYYLRLMVKDQIMQFNRLLQKQIELMDQMCPPGVASIPMSNGSHVPPLHQNSAYYAPEHAGPPLKSSTAGMIQGMNGVMIKSEAGYAGNSSYMFGNEGNVLESRPAIGDTSVSSFSSVASNSHPLNETLLDADSSSFGFLGQIPRNFSLSDLTADFSNSADILETYSRSPFLAAETDNFLDPHGRGEQGLLR